jgi:predicted nucleotidyltransferase
MLSAADRQTGEELSHRIRLASGDRVRKVILYGSRAQNTATTDSDFDLLVVEADPVPKQKEMQRLRLQLRDLPVAVDVWVIGEQEFEETKTIVGGLAYPAHKYGVVLNEDT